MKFLSYTKNINTTKNFNHKIYNGGGFTRTLNLSMFRLQIQTRGLNSSNLVSGFTLIETLIAIFIFSISITALFALSGTTTNSGQYSKNDIIATYLAQEAVDIIRNDRDSIIFQKFNQGGSTDWAGFISKYDSCFDSNLGCEIDAFTKSVYGCSGFDDDGFPACSKVNVYRDQSSTPNIDYYGIDPTNLITPINETSFRRKIVLYNNPNSTNSLVVVVTISWKNGSSKKTKVFTETLYDWYK